MPLKYQPAPRTTEQRVVAMWRNGFSHRAICIQVGVSSKAINPMVDKWIKRKPIAERERLYANREATKWMR